MARKKKPMIEHGPATIHYGLQNRDSTTGPLMKPYVGPPQTPDLDQIITGKKWPVPNSGTTRGSDIKKRGPM